MSKKKNRKRQKQALNSRNFEGSLDEGLGRNSGFSLGLAIGCLALFSFKYLWMAAHHPIHQGDTGALLGGVPHLLGCLERGQFASCAGVQHFPVFQHIPAALFHWIGLDPNSNLNALALLSGVSFIGMFFLGILFFRKGPFPGVGWLMALILLVSPFEWYGLTTFNETVAAFVTLLYTAAVLRERGIALQTVLFLLAGLTKETSVPFLFFIGLLPALRAERGRLNQVLRRTVVLSLGALLVFGANLGFNWFRYGTLYNAVLMNPNFQVPDFSQHLFFFLSLFFAPNGGLLFFWPCFAALLFFPFAVGFLNRKQELSKSERFNFLIPALVSAALLMLLNFGLARWFAPLGWVTWGPRLTLPWLPSLGLILCYSYAAPLSEFLKKSLHNPKGVILLGLALWLTALPHLGVIFGASEFWDFFAPNEDFPEIAYIDKNPDYYYRAVNHALWSPKKLTLVTMFSKALQGPAFSLSLLLGLVIFTILVRESKRLVRETAAVLEK
jgi:hypothetical protein